MRLSYLSQCRRPDLRDVTIGDAYDDTYYTYPILWSSCSSLPMNGEGPKKREDDE